MLNLVISMTVGVVVWELLAKPMAKKLWTKLTKKED